MRYLDRYQATLHPYAADLNSLRASPTIGIQTVKAVWFRRRQGTTVAVYGELGDCQAPPPATVSEFLIRLTDGRYGGRAIARWDGVNMWAPQMPWDDTVAVQKTLADALDGHPGCPAGYDGWWTFQ